MSTPTPCDSVGECLPGSESQTGLTCPAGYICENGVKKFCGPGEYPNNSNVCAECPAKFYCPGTVRTVQVRLINIL